MKCTSCQAELPDGFGVVNCSSCGAMYSIDLDGNLETFDVSLPPITEETPSFDEVVTPEVEFQDLMSVGAAEDIQIDSPEDVPDLTPLETNHNDVQEKPPVKLQNLLSDSQSGYALLYKVKISGLDHKEIQEQVMKELLDPALGLEVAVVKKMVQTGSLKFDKLAPLTAREIVLRLKDVPLTIDWEAYAD